MNPLSLIPSSARLEIRRYALYLLPPLAGLAAVYSIFHWPKIFYSAFPIPLAFILWHRIAQRECRLPVRFSLYACVISMGGFFIAMQGASYKQDILTLATAVGLFIFTPFKVHARFAIKNPRLAAIALYAAFSVYLYEWLNPPLWGPMYRPTGWLVCIVLRAFGLDPDLDFQELGGGVLVHTGNFNMAIFNGCSGLEGVTLFLLMLSVMLMLNWDYYRTRPVAKYYLFGAIYMLIINIFRIALFFMLGDWANNPGAGPLAQSLQGAPVLLFHSYIGWVFYLAAFWLFSGAINTRKPGKNDKLPKI